MWDVPYPYGALLWILEKSLISKRSMLTNKIWNERPHGHHLSGRFAHWLVASPSDRSTKLARAYCLLVEKNNNNKTCPQLGKMAIKMLHAAMMALCSINWLEIFLAASVTIDVLYGMHEGEVIGQILPKGTGCIFSCDQAALQMVFPSVRLSVCLSVTPFWLCSHHRIIMKFSGVITSDKSDVHAKGQGQRSKVKVTEVTTQLNRFRTVTPVWIHMWWWNDAYSLMLLRRGALLFFKVIRQISRSHGSKNRRLWPRLGVSGL